MEGEYQKPALLVDVPLAITGDLALVDGGDGAAIVQRDSVVYNQWVFGNDRKTTAMWEYWYSPELGINLLSIVSDPPFGKQVFTVSDVMLGESDVKLFDLPEGFEVVDRRPPAPPKVNTEPRPRAVVEESGSSSNN